MLLPKLTQLKSSSSSVTTMALFLTASSSPCLQQQKQLGSAKLWYPSSSLTRKRIQFGGSFQVKSLCSKASEEPILKTEAATGKRLGIEKEVLKAGNGPKPARGQSVTVHCTGFGKNGDLGQKFWSTKDPEQQPFTFNIGLGQVIKGWDEGVMGMQLGEVSRLRCTPEYGYGAGGFPAWGIQPNSVLIFEIEVLSIQ